MHLSRNPPEIPNVIKSPFDARDLSEFLALGIYPLGPFQTAILRLDGMELVGGASDCLRLVLQRAHDGILVANLARQRICTNLKRSNR